MGENELTSVENELGVSENYWKCLGSTGTLTRIFLCLNLVILLRVG